MQPLGVVGAFPLETFRLGDTQGKWKINRWSVNAPEMFKVLLRGKLGSNQDVVIVDDISVIDKPCESHRWEVNNFAQLYEETKQGEYIESDIMTASTGHKLGFISLKMTGRCTLVVRLFSQFFSDKYLSCPIFSYTEIMSKT